jgi:hypothetical protein
MALSSTRNSRTWVYATLVAICVLLLFYVGGAISRLKQPGYYHAPRTTFLVVSTEPKTISTIATEPIPCEIDIASTLVPSDRWNEYRSAESSSLALLTPPAGVRMMAPPSDRSPVEITYGRAPEQLANLTAQTHTVTATKVSNEKIYSAHSESARSSLHNQVIGTRTSSPSMQGTFPEPVQIRESIADLSEALNSEVVHADPSISPKTSDVTGWIEQVTVLLGQLAQAEVRDANSEELLRKLDDLANVGVKLSSQNLYASTTNESIA